MNTYFRPETPNLSSDFIVDGLRPVLRELEATERFILKDSQNRFYLWDEWDGRLFWVSDPDVNELPTLRKR